MTHRRNTLVVDLSALPKRPSLNVVKELLEKKLKLNMDEVKNIQLHNIKNCVFIEVSNEGVALRLQKQHHLRHSFVYLDVDYYIPVYVDGPTATVRLHDLPPQMSNTTITQHMEQYGKIISIHNEVWKNFFPGIPNGVRVIRLRQEKQIPSHIIVENEPTLVTIRDPNKLAKTHPKATSAAVASNERNSNEDGKAPVDQQNIDEKQSKTNNPPPTRDDLCEDDENNNDDDDSDNDSETEYNSKLQSGAATAKRRLSTGTNETNATEQESKKACGDRCCQGEQECSEENSSDAGWKIYNTRSKKKLFEL
ncbi:uncharacterized protein LOC134206166 [Armigeres subalbatus]|uniref:uncharacterized protein LOC134206166 n=1 Tax=Armigeres subalbatus TaxID=124917 RepID=UPI002ED1EB77